MCNSSIKKHKAITRRSSLVSHWGEALSIRGSEGHPGRYIQNLLELFGVKGGEYDYLKSY